MMYRLKDGLKPADYNPSMDAIRHELEGSIQYEQHRDNVDQAKKRAVKQFMDYEGFRQMVLGADLKTMNRDELKDLADPEKGKRFAQNILYKEDPNDDLNAPELLKLNQPVFEGAGEEPTGFKQTALKIDMPTESLADAKKELRSEDDDVPRSFREFKKSCDIILGKNPTEEREEVLIKWMQKCVPTKQLPILFTLDMDIEPLVWVVGIFDRLTKNAVQGKVPVDTIKADMDWFLGFFSAVSSLRTFNVGIKTMLKPTERVELKKVLERIEGLLGEGSKPAVDALRKAYLK